MTGHPLLPSKNGGSSGKYAHPSRKQARQHLRSLKRRGIGVHDVYRCPECGAWHLTHYPKHQSRAYSRFLRRMADR